MEPWSECVWPTPVQISEMCTPRQVPYHELSSLIFPTLPVEEGDDDLFGFMSTHGPVAEAQSGAGQAAPSGAPAWLKALDEKLDGLHKTLRAHGEMMEAQAERLVAIEDAIGAAEGGGRGEVHGENVAGRPPRSL